MGVDKGLKVGMLNVRSLWPNIDEVRIHFGDFDILGICETWLNQSVTNDMINLYKHKVIRQDRNTGKRGGGLVVYVSDKLYNHTCIMSDYSSITEDIEQLWILIDEPNVRKKIVGLLYRPPGGNAENCLSSLRSNLESIQLGLNCEISVMGDLNRNYKNRNTAPFRLLKEIERDFGLKQLITSPTRVTSKSSTLIDLLLTDCNHVVESGVLDISISDHLPIYYIKKKSRECNPKKSIKGRTYRNYVKEDYQHDIVNDERWRDFWNEPYDVNMLWETINSIIVDHANYYCPVVNMYVNENCPYWFSKDLIEEINHKNFLYKKAKSSGKDEDWLNFKYQKNLTKGMIFRAKDGYVNEQIDANLNDSKKLWRNVSALSGLGKNKSTAGMTEVNGENGTLLKDQEAADFMNKFYVSVGPKINETFANVWSETDFRMNIETSFEFEFITEKQVKTLVGQIDISKSAALGDLSTRLIKDAFMCITTELTQLYNLCLDSGAFPERWGLGIVSPLPKTTSQSKNPKDWRPITQIPLPGKLLERIVHTQMSNYLEGNNLLFTNQHGFRAERSTTSAVFDTLKTLFENWNMGLISTCVFIDFSRAFDTIDHDIFLKKLKLYGFDHRSLKFICSYMSSRRQCTRINGYTSNESRLGCGTAQGSILGPLFFILFVNGIFGYVTYNKSLPTPC